MKKSTAYTLLGSVCFVILLVVVVHFYSVYEARLEAERSQIRIQALKAKRAAAVAAEETRLAALSPAQRAAEEKEKQLKITAAEKATAKEKAEKAKQLAAEKMRDMQQQIAIAGALMLKRAMKDPEAFELKSLNFMQSGAACYDYRAKNTFGAMFPGSAILTKDGKILLEERHGNSFVAAWNKECTVAGGNNITSLAKIYLSR